VGAADYVDLCGRGAVLWGDGRGQWLAIGVVMVFSSHGEAPRPFVPLL
jgi:hypothetical protein